MKRDSGSGARRKRFPSGTPKDDLIGRAPLVFISHDSRDGKLAEAFELLLNEASGGVLKAFRSSDRKGTSGIEFGADWYSTIMARLDEASDVVALLTPKSLERPWILYEVGVARGKLDHPAFGVALGLPLEKITGPFAQFQNCDDDEDSLTKLVIQLIRRNPLADPHVEGVRRQVVAFRDRTADLLAAAYEQHVQEIEKTSPAKIFEEIKAMFEVLPTRVLATLGQRMPSLVDPAGPHWTAWLGDVRSTVAMMWSTPPALRSGHWSNVAERLQEYVPRTSAGTTLIGLGLDQGSEQLYRRGMDAFVSACSPYLESPAKVDKDAADILRLIVNALRHWLDSQPWSNRDGVESSAR